ncbi:MAG TPA: MFS transporter [Clostridia bacterium]|nr:MFS transporter [Clostridia bacterium]
MKPTYKNTLYACYLGFITLAIVNNFAPLLFVIFHDEFGISFEKIGRLILVNFTTQMVVDFLAIRYVDKIGYRMAAVLSHLFSVLGLISLGIFPLIFPSPYMGVAVAVVIYAIGGGLNEVIISPIVESLPGEAKASAMSLLHSFYCWGQLAVVVITTILIKLLGTQIWYILPVFWALIPIYNLFNFIRVPLMPTVSGDEKTPITKLLSSRIFLIAILLMISAGASELTMSQWSSLFAEKGLGVSKMVGDILGPALFAVFMGIGRVAYGVWGQKIDLKKVLMCSSILCILCYGAAVFIKLPIVSLLGSSLCGLAVSLMWPGTISLSAQMYPMGGTAMFSILALFGDVGASLGPWLAGFVSDLAQRSPGLLAIGKANALNPEQLGLKVGLFTAMIFPIILFVGIKLLRKERLVRNRGS